MPATHMSPEWQFVETWFATDGALLPKEETTAIRQQLQLMRAQAKSQRRPLSSIAEEILRNEWQNSQRRMASALVLTAKQSCQTESS